MLANSPSTDGAFVITRVFDAPRPLVWKAWSEAEQLQTWWGPKGCSIKVANRVPAGRISSTTPCNFRTARRRGGGSCIETLHHRSA